MNTRKKILLSLVVFIIVAAVCFLSWYLGFKSCLQACGMTKSMAEFILLNNKMEEQFSNASCDGVKLSINEYLEMLERNKNIQGSLVTNTSYYSDNMLSHLRLALIEHKSGNIEQEKKHMQLAQEACSNRKWKDCSAKHITNFVMRIDEKRPIACLAKK